MIKKITVIDQIEITRHGNIQVRHADLILEDGVEIAKTYHRHVLAPGDDLSGEDERVVAVSNAVWTPEVIETYQKLIKETDIMEKK